MTKRHDPTQPQLPIYPPPAAASDRTERARAIHHAVAEGRATWRTAFVAKALAGDLKVSTGQVYRKMDAAESFLRWLIVTRPAESVALLAALAAEAAGLLGQLASS